MVQTHQVETKGDACLKSCPVLFQRDEEDDAPQVTPPETPPSADTSDAYRKSTRIESGPKRSYEGMQGRQSGTGRPRKKFKYTILEVHGMSSMTNPFFINPSMCPLEGDYNESNRSTRECYYGGGCCKRYYR